MKKINVALVDDHKLFRSGIKSLIEGFGDYTIIFEASNGRELIEKIVLKNLPEIILLDIDMPLMDGIQTAEWLKENHPSIPVIILSMFGTEDKILPLLKLQIKGYLMKDAEAIDFKSALEAISEGKTFFPSYVTNLLLKNLNQGSAIELNDREVTFLKLICTQMTYKEIADKMCVSSRTVDGYRDQLFLKLNIKNRVGLVLYAIKSKLVEI